MVPNNPTELHQILGVTIQAMLTLYTVLPLSNNALPKMRKYFPDLNWA
jgi:hypothetical protein